jgi:hypothetical protein
VVARPAGWVGVVLVAPSSRQHRARGMRGSLRPGFQYWLKVTAISLPAFFLLSQATGGPDATAGPPPQFRSADSRRARRAHPLRGAEPTSWTSWRDSSTRVRSAARGRSSRVRRRGGGHVAALRGGPASPTSLASPHSDGEGGQTPHGGVHRGNAHPLFATYSDHRDVPRRWTAAHPRPVLHQPDGPRGGARDAIVLVC